MRAWRSRAVELCKRAWNERSTPRETGWSVAVGVASGCVPLFGLHVWIALALATLLRLNRLWAALASRVSFTPIYAPIAYAEIEAAHRLRTGAWAPLSYDGVLAHGAELLGDWLIGSILVGGALAAALGLAAYLVRGRLAPKGRAPSG